MVVGTTLFKLATGANYYSPTFPRGGLAGTFAINVKVLMGSPTFKVLVETRNEDETAWTSLGSEQSLSATGVAVWSVTDPSELCRIRYTFATADDVTDAAYFIQLPPTWQPYDD